MPFLVERILDHKWLRGTTRGSRLRRLFSHLVAALICILICEAFISGYLGATGAVLVSAIALVVPALVFFLLVCVSVVFLSSQEFYPDPLRLAWDTVLSITFTVLTFALLYRAVGFDLNGDCTGPYGIRDSIYFSSVTFSTLGYGDFRPCEGARLWAALQAIVGNLHLGLIVGAAFLSIQKKGG